MIGNDLTLTIGLPLVAGMSLRQLSGILAHEFGHFAQGAGMRLTFVIRAISLWFVRVVYERDAWDEKLDDWARSLRGGLALVLHLARFCVWLVRRILWCLMVIGHGISGFMLRQMEFDADRHEARLAGSAAFQGTSERLVELSAAAQMAQQDLGQFFSEGRLADDFPRLVLANVEQITPEMRTEILKHSLEAETGLFDTHPATRDRIASANRENASGLYRQPTKSGDHPETHPCHSDRRAAVERDAPSEGHLTAEVTDIAATDLFDDFPAVARTATLQYYCQALDREIRPDELHPVESLLGRQSADLAAGKALHRYFQGCCSPLRSIHLGDEAHLPLAIDDTTRTSLGVARDKALSLVASYRLTFREFDNADTEWLKAVRAQAILESHAKVNLSKLQIAQSSANEANTLRQSLEATMSSHEEALGPFEQSSATRLTIALRLTQTESIAREVDPDRDQRERTARLVSSITLVNGLSGKVTQVRNSLVALAALLNCIEGNEEHQGLITAIKSRAMELRTHLIELRDSLGDAPYPIEHASPDMTLARFVLVPPERGPDHTPIEIPFSDDIGNLLTIAKQAGERMSSLHLRLLAHAALLAERVESLLGFEPLPEPPQDNPSNAPQAISAGTSSA